MRNRRSPPDSAMIADPLIDASELRALRDQRALAVKLRGILEAVPDAIVLVDAEGAIQLVNAETERLFGYSRDQLVSRPAEILIAERFRAKHRQCRLDCARASGSGAALELRGVREDGSELAVEIRLRRVETEEGVLVASAIREADRLKSELFTRLSHELRTPLNAIIGFAALMHEGKVGSMAPQHHEYLGDILTSARHLLGLVNDVLDLSKIDAGKIDLRPERVDLGAIVLEVRGVLRELAARKRLSVDTAIEDGLGPVLVDPSRLKQVLYNLLSNAIKFTHDGGRITISVAAEGAASFRLSVRDTGIGISPGDIPKLFLEFQQLHARSHDAHRGTGLGLAITKSIVEAHGGRVEVESTPSAGSTFSVVLPRSPR